MDETETTVDSAATRRQPFGLRRRHYLIIRVALVAGILLLGATLHHHGAVYDAVRGAYLCIIVGLLVWRINVRRHRR